VPSPGAKADRRENLVVQPLTAMESKNSEPPEDNNGSVAGLVSRARMSLALNPRKKVLLGFLRRSLMRSLDLQVTPREKRVCTGGRSKELTPAAKYTKRKHEKHER
jgi:hypothetical protein